jgi:hypothetical protein
MEPEQNMAGRHIAVLVVKLQKQGKQAAKAAAAEALLALPTLAPGEIRVINQT